MAGRLLQRGCRGMSIEQDDLLKMQLDLSDLLPAAVCNVNIREQGCAIDPHLPMEACNDTHLLLPAVDEDLI